LCHFLRNCSEFLHEISHVCYSFITTKLLSSIVLLLFVTKLLNFLGDHVVISDVHGMSAEWKTVKRRIIFCNVTQSSSWFEQQNKQFSDTRSVYCQLSCAHLIAEWSFTNQSCDRSLWLVIPDHLQCLLAHGFSINNKCFTKSIKKLSMNKSDETYCLRSLLHFGINSTIFLIYLF